MTPDYDFEERAAIAEFDGRLNRAAAEALARYERNPHARQLAIVANRKTKSHQATSAGNRCPGIGHDYVPRR